MQGLVIFGHYTSGIVAALGAAAMAKVVFWREQLSLPSVLELPDYKMPRARDVLRSLMTRARILIKRAGTTIFFMTLLIWVLATFPRPPAGATQPGIFYSFAAMIGHLIEPVLAPTGFNWQISVALTPGMAV